MTNYSLGANCGEAVLSKNMNLAMTYRGLVN